MEEDRRRNSDKAIEELKALLQDTSRVVQTIHTNQALIKQKVENIDVQTTRTNGRVTALESWRDVKSGEFRIVCWVVAVVVVALVGAYANIFIR